MKEKKGFKKGEKKEVHGGRKVVCEGKKRRREFMKRGKEGNSGRKKVYIYVCVCVYMHLSILHCVYYVPAFEVGTTNKNDIEGKEKRRKME